MGFPSRKGPYRVKKIAALKSTDKNTWYSITVTEGKYHHIRKLAEALGHQVLRLRRVRIDGITVGRLKPGEWTHIDPDEIKNFLGRPRGRGGAGHPEKTRRAIFCRPLSIFWLTGS